MSYTFIINRNSFFDSNVAESKFAELCKRGKWFEDTTKNAEHYIKIERSKHYWKITPFYLVDDVKEEMVNFDSFEIDGSNILLKFLYLISNVPDIDDISNSTIRDSNFDHINF